MTSNDSIPSEKACIGCKEIKPLEMFPPDKRKKDGRASRCRKCCNLQAKKYSRGENAYWRRFHPPTPSESGVKTCPKCRESKDYSQFSLDRTRKDGYQRLCKRCCAEETRAGGYIRQYAIKNYSKLSLASAARNLKISAKEAEKIYNDAFVLQEGKCAICGEVETRKHKRRTRRLSLDHCHVTGKIRGLLCTRCNFGLGSFRDDLENLQNAIAYLQKHQQEA